jgi:hypothetical protein
MARWFLGVYLVFFTGLVARAAPAHPDRAAIEGLVVDETGTPVAGAAVRVLDWGHPELTTTTGADGRFRVTLDGPLANYRAVLAAGAGGKLLGRSRTDARDYGPVVTTRVTLKPAVELRVFVEDSKGQPVPGATVAVEDDHTLLAHGIADAQGVATFRVPSDANVHWVLGFRGGVGFDNFENYRAWPAPEPMPVPREVRLVLNGARSVQMRATDSAGRPIANVTFCPALMAKKEKIAFVASTSYLLWLPNGTGLPRTGVDGVATCDWFPLSLKRAVPFDPSSLEYHCPASPYIDMSTGTVPEPARLLRVVRCGGRVTNADGSPCPGVLVQAEGRGFTNHYCRQYGRTASDGNYHFDLYPVQGYVVGVADADRAATALTGIVIREGKPRNDFNFRLVAGTVIEGCITAGPKNEPVADQTVYLKQRGTPLPVELGKEVAGQQVELVRWGLTGSDGRYRLRVGPGDFEIAGPDYKFAEVKVGTEATLTRDFRMARPLNGQFEVAVRKPDGSPAAGATVTSLNIGDARTDERGRVRTKRSREPMLLYASDHAAGLAGFVRVGSDEESASLTMRAAASATGRVVGRDGKPRANYTVTCIARATGADPNERVRFTTYTGQDGAFVLPNLAEGLSCQLLICNAMRCGVAPAREFAVRASGRLDLGDVPDSLDPK